MVTRIWPCTINYNYARKWEKVGILHATCTMVAFDFATETAFKHFSQQIQNGDNRT
jgi:hypothetical protein